MCRFQQTFESWSNVFLISAAMLIGSGILYVCFADSTLQKWNSGVAVAQTDKEMALLDDAKKLKPLTNLEIGLISLGASDLSLNKTI